MLNKYPLWKYLSVLFVFLLGPRAIADEPPQENLPQIDIKALATAREQGLEWLTKNQAADGSWGA